MKLHKVILLTITLAILGGSAFAKPVDPAEACRVAVPFLQRADLVATPLGDALYLVRPVSGDGFVLVAADNCVAPILAYSTDGTFPLDEVPDHVQAWLDVYSADIAARRATGEAPSAKVQALWNAEPPKGGYNLQAAVSPMITTKWSQSPRYNAMCPADSYGRHAVTGCVATAQAQIMKYWNHPHHGRGSHQYSTGNFGPLSANFDTVYQWNNMPTKLGNSSSTAQINAVALLMYHVGVSVEMNYSISASGAQILEYYGASSERSLKNYFRYNKNMLGIRKSSYTEDAWDSIMLVEMHSGRPVLYTGFGNDAGHAFVIDGCSENINASTGLRYFHVNWGWSGSYDAYYTLNALNPGGGGTGSSSSNSYNSNCQALIHVKPIYNSLGDSLALIDVHSADVTKGTVSGNGIYRVDIDSVAIYATPAHGYRFDHWSSGSNINPVIGLADGDVIDTAYFLPIGTDTIGYCANNIIEAVKSSEGDTTLWGVRISADLRTPQRAVEQVQIYVYGSAYYTLNIYQGDTICSATLVYSKRDFFYGGGWRTFVLDSAVAVDNSRPLWITFMNGGREGAYPASGTIYCGNPDGSWYFADNRWQQYKGNQRWYTWMVRTIFTSRDSITSTVSLDMIYRNDTLGLPLPDYCSVSGEGTFAEGTTVTVSATAGQGDTIFRYWLTPWGSRIMDNPYTFVADYDLALTAVYASTLGVATADEADFNISVAGRTVSVEAPQGATIAAYDLQGRQLASGARFTLPSAGVYVVRVDGRVKKILIF